MPHGLEEIFVVVITDLDGTMLDQRTYSYEQSLPAIERLRQAEIPLGAAYCGGIANVAFHVQ